MTRVGWLRALVAAAALVCYAREVEAEATGSAIAPGHVEVPFFVFFASGDAEVAADDTMVRTAALCLREFAGASARLVGFTDRLGEPGANRALALERATRAATRLVEHGIAPARMIEVTGFGEDPALPENTQHPLGRRVEVLVTGLAQELPRHCPEGEELCPPALGPCWAER